jgi:Amino-transferase class IV
VQPSNPVQDGAPRFSYLGRRPAGHGASRISSRWGATISRAGKGSCDLSDLAGAGGLNRCEGVPEHLSASVLPRLPAVDGFSSPRLSIAVTPIVGDYINLAGVRCMISSWRRAPDVVLPGRAKLCGSYVGPALAKSEAIASGYDEAIMLNMAGYVAEGTTSNLFVRRGAEWLTPPVTDDILEGITRAQVKTLLAERTGMPVIERSIHRTELFVCTELLLCGTAALVVPVVEVDGRPVGTGTAGAVTTGLLRELQSIARRADGRHAEWTTPVWEAARGEG